jgi:hypothetical protein
MYSELWPEDMFGRNIFEDQANNFKMDTTDLKLANTKWNLVFFSVCDEGPWHHSLKAFCATPMMKMSSFLPSFTSNGAPVE